MAKRSISAGQQDDLHSLGCLAQDFHHQIEPGIIGIDERIIENQRNRPALFQQHVRERDPRQHCELLLRAAR